MTRRALCSVLVTAYSALFAGVPTLIAVGPVLWLAPEHAGRRALAVLLAPCLWALAFVFLVCLLSLPHQRGVRAGKHVRDTNDPVYFHRRLYGACLTALYYCKPVWWLVLNSRCSTWIVFRMLGYRGPVGFTLYPDTWIRDLPLLSLGSGAYVANRATLGTNMPTVNGRIIVEPIEIGAGSYVGHAVLLGPGVRIGSRTQVDAGAAVNLKASIGSRCTIGPSVGINHWACLEDDVKVGACSYIGTRAYVANGIRLPPNTVVPDGERVLTQADVARLHPRPAPGRSSASDDESG